MRTLAAKLRHAVSPARLATWIVERLCRQEIVQQGPFAAMRLSAESSFVSVRTLLLGTYEMELWSSIQQGIQIADGAIVVGAAEGYYAVGLARLLPGKQVIAFEMDPKGRRLLAENAGRNQVANRLEILGECDAAGFRQATTRFLHPFVVVDVEGAEVAILGEGENSAFAHTTFLVEIHDFVDRSLGERLRTRFQPSHSITEIWQQSRHPKDLPRSLPSRHILWRWYRTLISENRPERMRWFYLRPKIAPSATSGEAGTGRLQPISTAVL